LGGQGTIPENPRFQEGFAGPDNGFTAGDNTLFALETPRSLAMGKTVSLAI
jgi:hypothetical protein